MTTAARGLFLALVMALALPLESALSEPSLLPPVRSGVDISAHEEAGAGDPTFRGGDGERRSPDPLFRTDSWRIAQSRESAVPKDRRSTAGTSAKKPAVEEKGTADTEKIWRSDELEMLGIGMGIGDVEGTGRNGIVIISPNTVYLYRIVRGRMELVTEYSAGSLELKAVDVAKIRKQGPARIYVSAQNRGAVASFVLEYRNGKLEPVIQDFRYFLRVIIYPTRGPVLLCQQKGLNRMYEGPVTVVIDKGNELEVGERFGIPLKIPIFGFAIGDLTGNRSPLIAAYDKDERLRIYDPSGKRLYVSKDYFAGSDIVLRWSGPENRRETEKNFGEAEKAFFRPRIMCLTVKPESPQEILTISHTSKTGRFLSRTKMLEDGKVLALAWNGDATEDKWKTPPIQGMVTDFAVDFLPDLAGRRLIVLERKRTDWLSFIRSRSQVKAYDVESLVTQGLAEERR